MVLIHNKSAYRDFQKEMRSTDQLYCQYQFEEHDIA